MLRYPLPTDAEYRGKTLELKNTKHRRLKFIPHLPQTKKTLK